MQLPLFDRHATAAAFPHLEAERCVQLQGQAVAYRLRRSRRRSIGFTIAAEGLAVSAPRWVAQADIEAALQAKAAWIVRKLHEQRERARRLAATHIDWRDGARLPFLGQPIELRLGGGATGALLGADNRTLHLGLPTSATPRQVQETVQGWLQRQARRVFEERCTAFAPRLGVHLKRLSLSSAATRWGSASADGSVRLHWRLVHFALPVIDYVVVHELAHLREMNHSAAFWDVVRTALPDYEAARGALRNEVLPAFDKRVSSP